MSMTEWAEREIEIACKREKAGAEKDGDCGYGCACYQSAFKAFKSLMEDGHSGYSIGLTQWILNRLIDGKTLTPIEDTDDIWDERSFCKDGHTSYQCNRMSSLFKDVYEDGRIVYSDTGRVSCIYVDNPSISWSNSHVRHIIDEMFPITMPYTAEVTYRVYCEELLTDRKNGDYDTKGILYVVDSKGNRTEIRRFFKEDEETCAFVEITSEEYEQRRVLHNKRIEKESEE